MPRTPLIAVLAVMIAFTGCKKQENCAAGDSAEVCNAFQECLKSNTSAEVCRLGEQDASRSRKDLAPAYNGVANALKGSSSQKPAPQQPPEH
jgi:uncharacterized protein YgiB involved in biofilm formation